MDVNAMSQVSAGSVGQFTTNKNSAAKNQSAVNSYANTAKQTTAASTENAAFSVDISDAAKQAAQESEDLFVNDTSAEKTKGLTPDQLQTLKDEQQATMLNLLIQALTDHNGKLQDWLDNGIFTLNFGGNKVSTSAFALPEVATNPEDAAKAVADGGEWSVNAVSDRIFGLAETLAGGDPEKLQQMRDAVEQGFKEAGMVWKEATGESDMPEITKNTYSEIMKRFNEALQ